MVINKRYIIILSILIIICIFTGCTVRVKIDIESAIELKKEISQISSNTKYVQISYSRPSIWFDVSFSEEPPKEEFDKIFLTIQKYMTKENMEEIDKKLETGSIDKGWVNFDLNNDGYNEYRFNVYVDYEWNSFDIPIGNSSTNLINGDGMIAVENYNDSAIDVGKGNYIYYVNIKDGDKLYKMKATGNKKQKVIDEAVKQVSIIGDYIYYVDKDGYICKFNKTKNSKSIVVKEKCAEFVVSGYWIYYTNDKSQGVYKIRTDGKNQELLISEYGYDLSIRKNDFLYYISESGDTKTKNTISIINLKTKEKNILNYNATRLVCQNQGRLYYLDGSNNNYLNVLYYDPYLPNKSARNIKLTNCAVGSFSIINWGICYENLSDNKKIYKINWDGTESIKIIDDQCNKISSIYNYIYYINDNDELIQYDVEFKKSSKIY